MLTRRRRAEDDVGGARQVAMLVVELVRVGAATPLLEAMRRLCGPRRCASVARSIGRHQERRSPEQRRELQRVVRSLDRLVPGGPNCFRRCLLETALDRGAAEQKIVLGLKAHGGRRSGHAWLADGQEAAAYDAEIVL